MYPGFQPTIARPFIWAVGGGKGGIGKSFVTSSLAIHLAQMGYKTVLIDLDLGSPNAHTCLGAQIQSHTLSDFLSGRVQKLQDIVIPTSIRNLSMVSGFNDSLNAADITASQRERLISQFRFLEANFVLLDLSAGTHENTLDFFLSADKRVVVLVPEPTSIENGYRFIKASFYRQLRLLEKDLNLQSVIEEAMDHKNLYGIRSPADLVRFLVGRDPTRGLELSRRLHEFRVELIINQVRTKADHDLGESVKSVCRKYFGVDVELAGVLDQDNAVWQAMRKKRPALLEYPQIPLYAQLLKVTKVLLGQTGSRAAM